MNRQVRTVTELKKVLVEDEKIHPNCFYFNEGPAWKQDESYCIVYEDGKWKVFYSERGKEKFLKIFDIEAEACQYFYEWVIEDKEYLHGISDEELEEWKKNQGSS